MKTRPIPVRLDERTCLRLKRAAEKVGINNVSAIIKLAIANQLPQIEAGFIQLNPDPARGAPEQQ